MPIQDKIPTSLPFLYLLLSAKEGGLEKKYFQLLKASEDHRNMHTFIEGFLRALDPLYVTAEYQPWQTTGAVDRSAKRIKVR